MFKILLHIALSIALILAITGVTVVQGSCGMLQSYSSLSLSEKDCCKENMNCDCSYEINLLKSESDRESYISSVSLPGITFLLNSILSFEFNASLVGNILSYSSYRPPSLYKDISILVQCFRL